MARKETNISETYGYQTLLQKNEAWLKILGSEQLHKAVGLRMERNSPFKKF